MRSIRRSMTAYLLVLLALALGVAWIVIDMATARALEAREAAGAALVESRYAEQCRDERDRTEQVLLQQAKELGNLMQTHYATAFKEELLNYGLHATAAQWMFVTNPVTWAGWTSAFNHNHGGTPWNPNPQNTGPAHLFRMYFANLPLPEEYIQHFDDKDGSADYYQINTQSGREWHSKSLGASRLPFELKESETRPIATSKLGDSAKLALIDWGFGEATVGPNHEKVLRVLYKAPHFTSAEPIQGPRRSPFGGPYGVFRGPPQRSLLGEWVSTGFAPPTPSVESLPRFYIQCARPQASIDSTIARFSGERDIKLTELRTEITAARKTLRTQIAGVGALAFLAVAIGGPLLVGRGLRPVGKLSDAVSRVSEKDFKLPHDGSDLSVELVPIHARLTQTLDLLQRAFAREKQAVADISHELRTPIAALMATIDVALRKPRTSEQYRSALEDCRLISKQLGQLVERIMTLASLDAGNDRTQISLIDVAEMATGCAAVIRPLAAAHGVTVEVAAEGPLDLETDSPKLREVLMNLLHNSVEYNRPGGQIDLSVWSEDQSIIIEVRDTGIGMTPDVKDKIFERFYRADPSRQATGIHAGLGLAIVKEYVNRLGGTITVESSPDVGSTFRVTIPAPLIVPSATEKAGAVPVSANP